VDAVPEWTFLTFNALFWLRLIMVVLFWGFFIGVLLRYNNATGNDFKVIDLLMENGRASKWAVIIMAAFGLSCVVMTGWFLNQVLQWSDFLAFLGVWIAPLIAKMFANGGSNATK